MIGYCCNVHPGNDLSQLKHSLAEHAVSVRNQLSPTQPLPIGLWLSETTTRELKDLNSRAAFREWLEQNSLLPYTLNGFPFGDFHQPVVKHRVYQPTWAEESRLEYTWDLACVLHDLLPAGLTGSISTLPLGWPGQHGKLEPEFLGACVANLNRLAKRLANLRDQTGRRIVVCIEPEPGCMLDTAPDLVRFFDEHLMSSENVKAHLGVCHDICHSAVMFEHQETAIQSYRLAGITIGKVQVSSALKVELDRLPPEESNSVLNQLAEFAEVRYLHQTLWRRGDEINFFEDLDPAIAHLRQALTAGRLEGEARTHFHVPVFADRLGKLSTTQGDIDRCFQILAAEGNDPSNSDLPHFEVETYAWNVIPREWQPQTLASGITRELQWCRARLQASQT